MKNTIFKLFKRDLSKIIHSKPVLITILAFCLVPASYAVLNIKASWDPYSTQNIRRLPIAVVNDDEGSTLNGKNINVGKEVITKLKKNHDVKWMITNDWDGNNGLDQGKYYAMIEIPSDFSSRLASLASDNPQKPTVVYKSNEKLNPAATKITGQAKDTLTEQIRSNFTQLSGSLVLKKLNQVGADLDSHRPEILGIRNSLNDSIGEIKKADQHLNRVNRNSKDVQKYLKTVKNGIPKVSAQITDLSNILSQQQNLISTTKNNLAATKNSVNNAMDSIQNQSDSLQSAISGIDPENNSGQALARQATVASRAGNALVAGLNDGIRVFDIVGSIIPSNRINNLVVSFTNAKKQIKQQQRYLNGLQTGSGNNPTRLTNKINSLNDKIQDELGSAATTANSTENRLDSLGDTTASDSSNNSDLISSLREVIPELKAMQSAGNSISGLSVNRVKSVQEKLDNIKSQLSDLDDQLSFLNSRNLDKLINLLGKDPDIASILASPIKLKSKELYNMGVFGYGATPFYTVLSIWIGVLLLTTIISWKYAVGSTMRENKIRYYQTYGGKFLLYLTIAFTQTLFTFIGEIGFLGIRPHSLLAFTLIDFFTALVFTMIIFSLVFSFGNVGKVVGVLLMILQIFGTGGLYPLEVIPQGLTSLTPYLPFTYSISAFREAISGPDWRIFFNDLLILAGFGLFFVTLTPISRRLFRKPIHALEEGFEKSQL